MPITTLTLAVLALSCMSIMTRGRAQSIFQTLSIATFILFVGVTLYHLNIINVSSLSSLTKLLPARDTVLIHDTTVIVDSVFVVEESGAPQDGTEAATEAPSPRKAPSVTKKGQRKGF